MPKNFHLKRESLEMEILFYFIRALQVPAMFWRIPPYGNCQKRINVMYLVQWYTCIKYLEQYE